MSQSIEHQALAFFRSKPADEEYDYSDNEGCALFQFLKDSGYPVAEVNANDWLDIGGARHPLPHTFKGRSWGGLNVLIVKPRTFGALADRLEKALAK